MLKSHADLRSPSTTKGPHLKTLKPFLDAVIHADCLDILPELPDESIDLVVTDPPYLVNYRPRDGRKCTGDNTDYWLRPSFRELYRVLKPDSFCATFYGWPWIDRFMTVWKESGFRPVSHLTWIKLHCSREGYTRSFHEVGFLLAKGKPRKPVIPLQDVMPWEYTGNLLHPNEKPLIALEPLMLTFSNPGDIILDPFAGSGTTGVAAKLRRCHYILIEKDATHCRTAEERLSRM